MKIYHFEETNNCEMCGDNTSTHKVIGQRLNKSQRFNPRNKMEKTHSGMQLTLYIKKLDIE